MKLRLSEDDVGDDDEDMKMWQEEETKNLYYLLHYVFKFKLTFLLFYKREWDGNGLVFQGLFGWVLEQGRQICHCGEVKGKLNDFSFAFLFEQILI